LEKLFSGVLFRPLRPSAMVSVVNAVLSQLLTTHSPSPSPSSSSSYHPSSSSSYHPSSSSSYHPSSSSSYHPSSSSSASSASSSDTPLLVGSPVAREEEEDRLAGGGVRVGGAHERDSLRGVHSGSTPSAVRTRLKARTASFPSLPQRPDRPWAILGVDDNQLNRQVCCVCVCV
jgi:hypothetical protein